MINKDELKKLDSDSLKKEIFNLKKELFNLKLNLSGGEVKDYSQFKKLRASVAQALTFLEQNSN